MNSSSENQDPDSSKISFDDNLQPDETQDLSNQSQNLHEILNQIDKEFDKRHSCYNCWLYFMLIISGFWNLYVWYISLLTLKDREFPYRLLQVKILALSTWFFSQFFIEIWAIGLRELSKANLGLIMITVSSLISLGFAGSYGFELNELYENWPTPPEMAFYRVNETKFFLILALIICVSNIFFTNLPAIKVRNDLKKREMLKAKNGFSLVVN